MPSQLRRYHHSGQAHFITFTCYHRQRSLISADACDLFVACLEDMRRKFQMYIYGYVVMPEHVHLLLSEPETGGTLADAMHYLKLASAKRYRSMRGKVEVSPFWQKRYFDRNIRPGEFGEKLDYLHWNPVKRGLASDPKDWQWSSFRHYAFRETGVVEIESDWTVRARELGVR